MPLISETHRLATFLAQQLSLLEIKITRPVETNMVWFSFTEPKLQLKKSHTELVELLQAVGIRISDASSEFRLVLHFQIDQKACEQLVKIFKTYIESQKS